MTEHVTRRQAIKGIGSTIAVASGASLASASETPADAVVDADRDDDADYPRCLYKPDEDGEWNPVLPINIHAPAPGAESALAAVENDFSGLGNLEWTRVFPDSTAKAWDSEREALVAPDYSFRRPRLGDEWNHIHIWGVDENRVGIHAHLDVIDLTASHFHRGDHYGDAAREVTDHLTGDGWRERRPYSIDYGVEPERLKRWGETGDVKLEY
ncbi:hypothetical protein GS429_18540 [Natronorubrum sp. JWXQ-INN-674]|uniref:Uncharacterized protein n=1 Tax=Natronorubrum halalkaliphilum TaxID=2691917 RepID=A0A6B0VRQ6_9EURY|nr:hypothetical protein [Natronorubrum halalkaliphilum]MXV64025.1 hypothetical protein [Natronorubrum halalkaliphilum]